MTRNRVLVVAAMALMLFTTTAAFALLRETDINYYYDDTFVTWVGEHYVDCDGTVTDSGSLGSWRVYDQYSCRTGDRVVHLCQQTDGMGGWINLSCPANQP
jgi:hypothetical protein